MQDPTQQAPTPPRFVTRMPISTPEAGQIDLFCPSCKLKFSPSGIREKFDVSCPYCRRNSSYFLFPRIWREPSPAAASNLAANKEATCQFYPELRADLICDECGAFLSHKASIEWAGKNLCMPCLYILREQKADSNYQSELKIWDNRALFLLLLLPVSLVTAPLAVYQLIRYRQAPRGWVPRSSFRWGLALCLAVAVFLGWLTLIVIWAAVVYREIGSAA